jgi:hypothetical protein
LLQAYEEAENEAEKLDKTNPVRLGLALNQSVFFYEICEKKELASKKAREEREERDEGSLQLVRINLYVLCVLRGGGRRRQLLMTL